MSSAIQVQHRSSPRLAGVRAVLFDLDRTLIQLRGGTVADVSAIGVRNAHRWLSDRGRKVPEERVYVGRVRWALLRAWAWSRLVGREVDLIETLRRCHRRMKVDWREDDGANLAMEFALVFREMYQADEEATATLRQLHEAGLRLGLVSNTMLPAVAVDEHLRSSGMLEFLPVRVLSSESGFMKPDLRIFRLALDRVGVPAGETVFVGDRPDADVAGARRAGMATIFRAYNGRLPRGARRADAVIRRLAEIPAMLGVGVGPAPWGKPQS